MTALLNRTQTFLSEPHWLATPFEYHPKSPLDHLLDLLSSLPAIRGRADRVLAQQHTLARRLTAQDLLNNCLDMELELGRWYSNTTTTQTMGGQQQQQPLFWLTSPPATAGAMPFPAPLLSFRDAHAALALGYYWIALVLLYQTVWKLYFAAVIDPVIDAAEAGTGFLPPQAAAQQQGVGMNMGMHMGWGGHDDDDMGMGMGMGGVGDVSGLPVPPRLQALDPMRYSLAKVREMAGNVCRVMEFLLGEGCVQPDLMWHMLLVVARFFEDIGNMGEMVAGPGDGRLELMWCEGFRERLMARGREMHEVVLGRRWVDLASF
jgi:hypothetical protein